MMGLNSSNPSRVIKIVVVLHSLMDNWIRDSRVVRFLAMMGFKEPKLLNMAQKCWIITKKSVQSQGSSSKSKSLTNII